MSDTVYANPKYRDVDVGAIMRVGHPDIAEGDERIVAAVRKLHADRGGPLRIIDVGSGSGDLSLMLAQALSDCEVIANDTAPNPVAQAADKLAPFPRSSVYDKPFEQWPGQADVVISWGSHHHLAHDYLDHVRKVLTSGGLFIVGDEFCPEYCTPADKKRLAKATQIPLVDGYVFDNVEVVIQHRDADHGLASCLHRLSVRALRRHARTRLQGSSRSPARAAIPRRRTHHRRERWCSPAEWR